LYKLDVKSTTGDIARFNGSGSTGCTLSDGGVIACSSDLNLKKNVENSAYGLDTIMALNPVEFNWKSEENSISKSLGFIAQDIEIVIPKLVSIDGNGNRELNTIGLIPVLTKGLQELASSASKLASKQDVISLTDRMDLADERIASISAQLLDLSLSEATTSANLSELENLTINNELNVLGASTFGDISITGNISAGLISIDGLNGSIQTLSGPLELQQNALANLEVFGGKITMTTDGSIEIKGTIKADEVETNGVTLYDEVTSEPYCIKIKLGEMVQVKGLCRELKESTSSASPSGILQ
ncbi:hypothetical protein CO050_03275, partial [Candidatus Roizmanbacteria bacterium CG_4_9_14_0_2_um_filter_38_17]